MGISSLFFKEVIYLFLERERNMDRLPLACPQPGGTWSATQACALTESHTEFGLWDDSNTLSHTGQSHHCFQLSSCNF